MYVNYQAIEEIKESMEYLWHLEQVQEDQQWTSQVLFLAKFFNAIPGIALIYTWEWFTATSPGPTDF